MADKPKRPPKLTDMVPYIGSDQRQAKRASVIAQLLKDVTDG